MFRVCKKEVVAYPAVQEALSELHVSPKRLRLSSTRRRPESYRGECSFTNGTITVWLDSCDSFKEVVWVVLHELRHMWQGRHPKLFALISGQEKLVMHAFQQAYNLTYHKVVSEYHEALPSEVDANVYATTKLGEDHSSG